MPGESTLYKTREYFNEYVLPLLTSAAIDYEKIEIINNSEADTENSNRSDESKLGFMNGRVHEYIKLLTFQYKRNLAQLELAQEEIGNIDPSRIVTDPNSNHNADHNDSANENNSNMKTNKFSKYLPPEVTIDTQFYKSNYYNALNPCEQLSRDILVIGRNSYAETINGFYDGLITTSLHIEKPESVLKAVENGDEIVETKNDDETKVDAKGEVPTVIPENMGSDDHITSPPRTQVSEKLEFPKIGYLGFNNITGFVNVPKRLYNWFNNYSQTKYCTDRLEYLIDQFHTQPTSSSTPFPSSADTAHRIDYKLVGQWEELNLAGFSGKECTFVDFDQEFIDKLNVL
ncbi:hypothetical protein AX774_g716 [Zancudomyces culisetae]|nr:hypothetical protein AX774_g716 [Zancudomyces culisetae]|eukprot:OMH85735.1 hypothetical protein AX774_g716 [Zancudomyces culisetae]